MRERLMTEQEYHDAPGINSSSLMRFSECPASVLMPREEKSYFRFGHLFEDLARATWSGWSGFAEKYSVADLPGTMPDRLFVLINDGADLSTAYVLTKNGERNKQQETLHAWLDVLNANPGKEMVGTAEMDQLASMVKNLGRAEAFPGITVADLLSDAEWQVPFFWDGKKCLFDAVATLDDGRAIIVDLKTMATSGKFYGDYRRRYWIQDRHYVEGARRMQGGDLFQDAMIFAAAAKDAPFIGQCFELSEDRREEYDEAYFSLIERYREWEAEGRPKTAWKEKAVIR